MQAVAEGKGFTQLPFNQGHSTDEEEDELAEDSSDQEEQGEAILVTHPEQPESAGAVATATHAHGESYAPSIDAVGIEHDNDVPHLDRGIGLDTEPHDNHGESEYAGKDEAELAQAVDDIVRVRGDDQHEAKTPSREHTHASPDEGEYATDHEYTSPASSATVRGDTTTDHNVPADAQLLARPVSLDESITQAEATEISLDIALEQGQILPTESGSDQVTANEQVAQPASSGDDDGETLFDDEDYLGGESTIKDEEAPVEDIEKRPVETGQEQRITESYLDLGDDEHKAGDELVKPQASNPQANASPLNETSNVDDEFDEINFDDDDLIEDPADIQAAADKASPSTKRSWDEQADGDDSLNGSEQEAKRSRSS